MAVNLAVDNICRLSGFFVYFSYRYRSSNSLREEHKPPPKTGVEQRVRHAANTMIAVGLQDGAVAWSRATRSGTNAALALVEGSGGQKKTQWPC